MRRRVRVATDKKAMNVAAAEKAVADVAAVDGATTKVASRGVAESTSAPVVGTKRAAVSGSSSPPYQTSGPLLLEAPVHC
jgi:hypothetical protein